MGVKLRAAIIPIMFYIFQWIEIVDALNIYTINDKTIIVDFAS
jgi:hypothetical protein